MIEITVNGAPFTDFTEASVNVSLDSLSNDFTFIASAVNGFPPLKERDAVTVLVDRVKVLTGFIGEVNGEDKEGQHLVTYTGRDKTGDFFDSQIDVLNDIKASENLTLKRIIEIVIAHLGLDLKVVDNLNPAPFSLAEDIVSPEVGQNAFDFVSKYAKKRQALLSSTADGDILITQSSPVDSGAVVQRLQGASDNNILSQSWAINGSQKFNKYIHHGQLDPRAVNLSGITSSATLTNQGGESIDSSVRVGRQRVKIESESYSSAQLQDRAKWARQLSNAQAITLSCSVRGHQKPLGGLWETNTLVQVNSDTADINRKMLLNNITFSQGEGRPTISTLKFVEKNVYTINEKLLSQRPVGVLGNAYKSVG